jgi:hypothetical protein
MEGGSSADGIKGEADREQKGAKRLGNKRVWRQGRGESLVLVKSESHEQVAPSREVQCAHTIADCP